MRRSLTTIICAITAASVLGAATDALACRMSMPHAGELAKHGTMVIATVKQAERVEASGWNTWRIVAEGTQIGASSLSPSEFRFSTSLSSSGCGQTPLPPTGERWVLYLDSVGSSDVLDAFPLEYVRGYDPRLADVR